jgi:hypothetical protein
MTSTVQFGSLEFYEAMAEALNADPVWLEKGAGITYTMLYRYGPPQEGDFWIVFDHGKVTDVRMGDEKDVEAADFVISGPSDVWRSVFEGNTNPTVALARGHIKVKGEAKLLVKNMGAFKYVIEAMGRVPFE